MGTSMEPFVDQLGELLLPLILFKYSENVRCSAAFSVAQLMQTYGALHRTGCRSAEACVSVLEAFVETLVAGVKGEIHAEPRSSMAEALRDVLRVCFESGGKGESGDWSEATIRLPIEATRATLEALSTLAAESVQRRQEHMREFEENEVSCLARVDAAAARADARDSIGARR
jgi:hypothetical protein